MSLSLSNILKCYLIQLYLLKKDESIIGALQKDILKTYKPSPPMLLVRFPNYLEQLFQKKEKQRGQLLHYCFFYYLRLIYI